MRHLLAALALVLAFVVPGLAQPKADGPPVSADPRLVVERFAAAPDIVQPIAADFDAKGRLLVVESHTHFRPAKYAGPKFDRVRVLEDTNGDGKADKFTTFFEGTTATMDVATHPDGSVYVATRNEVLRLRDTDGDGKADQKTRIAFLDTTGNYPHNGLAGLTFDARGDLYFGMGENLGAPYKLIGSDGTTLSGGGEGGNFYGCTADGQKLRRIATGFWNPFGACRDIFGRLWVVDNDPDSSPPCRLLYIVEGGDYGYQFRYGRSGRHPFQAWNGELPGTLPMAAGTGESPCEVVSYESDGLPDDYRGHLLVPAWADHRLERYVPKANGAGMTAERKPFVQGGKDFYPSGLAVASDGSLFVPDWGSKSYELHGKGAVWRVRWKDPKPTFRPKDLKLALLSPHRPIHDAAAGALAKDEPGRRYLRVQLRAEDVRVRAAALNALIAAGDEEADLTGIAKSDSEPGLRAMAVRALVARKADLSVIATDKSAPANVRAEAVAGVRGEAAYDTLLGLINDRDPFLRHAAIQRLAHMPEHLRAATAAARNDAKLRVGVILAHRAAGSTNSAVISDSLADPDPDVQLLAAKWVADEKLTAFREQVAGTIRAASLDPRTFQAFATALARTSDRPPDQDGLAFYFLDALKDERTLVPARTMILRSVPAAHPKLKTELLMDQLKFDVPAYRVELLRVLKDRAHPKAMPAVRELISDTRQAMAVRAQAVHTLAALGQAETDRLIEWAGGKDAPLRQEALRGLVQVKLSADQRAKLESLTADKDLVARLLGKSFHANRPPATDTDAWLKRLEEPADPEAGRRVFEHPKLANCSKCHRVDGRGADIGPDLSLVGRTDRRWIVESLLQPSAAVAPHFLAWKIDTTDGRTRTGQLVHTHLDESYYVDAKGDRFKVLATDVAELTAARGSIMPDGLLDNLTDQEVRDLVAYLASRK